MANKTIMDRVKRGDFDMYEVPEDGPEVASWCPSPTPTVPPTQVHLFLPMHGAVFVIRFKSPRTLDALIAALQSHREDVFGKPAPKVDDATRSRLEALEFLGGKSAGAMPIDVATKHAERHANGLCDADTCPVCAGAANDVAPSCRRDTSCLSMDGHAGACVFAP